MKRCFGVTAAMLFLPLLAAAGMLEVASVKMDGGIGKVTTPAPGVFRMEAMSGKNPPGRSAQYSRFVLHLKKPIDLRNRTLTFKASTGTGDRIVAFYIRAFGTDLKKPDASFLNYTPLFRNAAGPLKFQLREKRSTGNLTWEDAVVTGNGADSVSTLQFLVGTRSANSKIELTISDLELSGPVASNGGKVIFSGSIPPVKGRVKEIAPGKYQMTAMSGKNPPGTASQYCTFSLEFAEPVDLRNNRLHFNVSSSTGDKITAFYVRCYGTDRRKPDASFFKYSAIFKGRKDPLPIRIQEKGSRGLMAWESAVVTGKPADRITRIQFWAGTRSENSEITLTVSDFTLVSTTVAHRTNAADAVPEFFKTVNLSCGSGEVTVQKKNSLLLVSPGNTRVTLDVDLPFTVDMTGMQLAFTVKSPTPGNITGLHVRLQQDGDKKPAWFHSTWGDPLGVTPGGRFVVYENSAVGVLRSEYRSLSHKPAKKINRIGFSFSTMRPERGDIRLEISDIRIEPRKPTGLKAVDNWSPVPVYAKTPAKVKHPVGPIRADAILRARENIKKHQWAAGAVENYRRSGQFWLNMDQSQISHWIPAGEAFFKCVCPNCRTATEFAWAGTNAISKDGNTLICQKCKMTFPNEKYPENHTYTVERPDGSLKTLRCYLGPDQITGGENMGPRHHITGALNYVKLRFLASIRYTALLYTLEPKKEYAQRVRDVLLRAAEVYPGYSVKFRSTAYKNPREGHYMAGKFHSWKFMDSVIMPSLMLAYTLTYNSGVYSDADKVAIENGLAREYLWMITAYPPNADYCSNAVPAHYNAAAFCAAVLGDHDAMEWVLQSLPDFLRAYYRRDGFWHEVSPSYSNMANGPLNLLAATLHGYSDAADYRGRDRYDNIDIVILLPQLTRVLNCMAPGVLPTGCLPAVNDSVYNARQTLLQLDVLACLDPSAKNKQLAAYMARRYPSKWERDNLFYRPVDADPMEPRPEILNHSRIIPGGGWAILRRPESAEKSATVLVYSAFSTSHMHHGTLGFLACEDGKEVISDLGYQSCWHPQYRWITSPLAHNLVLVDGGVQGNGRYGEVELFAGHTDTLAVRVAGYRIADPAVTRHARTLIDLPLPGARKYLVDLFETRGGKQHMYVFHADGPGFSAGSIDLKPDKAGRIGPPSLGTPFLENVRSAGLGQGTHRFMWTFDNENVTTSHLALNRSGRLFAGVGPGARAHSLAKKPLHVIMLQQNGPETLFAAAMESTAPGQEAIQKVERKDFADHTVLTIRHKYGHDIVTHYRNGDLTVARYQAEGKLASVWIAGDRELAGVKGHPEYRGKVLSVGKDGRTLTTGLTGLPAGYDLAGKILSFDGMGDGAYRIASAEMKGKNIIITLDPEEIPRDVTAGRTFRFRPVVEKIFLPRR